MNKNTALSENFKIKILALFEKEGYSLLEPFKGSKKSHAIKCPVGHITSAVLSNFFTHNSRCKLCWRDTLSSKRKTPFEEIVRISKERNIILVTDKIEYDKNHHGNFKISVQCKCNRIVDIFPKHLKIWEKCFDCNSFKKNSKFKDLNTKFNYIKEKGYEAISAKGNGSKDLLLVKCKIHGEWETSWHNFYTGHECPKCGREKTSKSHLLNFDFIKQEIEKIGYKLISTEYNGSKDPIAVECTKGHEWKTIWNSIEQGQRCPRCGRNGSEPQGEIFDFIKSVYNGPIVQNDRIVLSGLELDIWLPELKIGIEHDGLYWHSKFKRPNAKADHLKKIKTAQKLGITFLAFFGDEWIKKQNIVKSIIKNKIGAISNKIYARKCEFTEITNKEAKEFLNGNHLEGYVKCNKAFGLKYNNKLVMCVTFRKTMKNEHELARMATLIDHVVVGGASKLLKHAPKPLISYSNNRLSNGEVYKELGFEEITETTQPSYFYTDFIGRVFRTQCMKIKGLPGTEEEQALAGAFSQKRFGHNKPLYKIYDYGHRKWIKID